jgi:hypothetical protein
VLALPTVWKVCRVYLDRASIGLDGLLECTR